MLVKPVSVRRESLSLAGNFAHMPMSAVMERIKFATQVHAQTSDTRGNDFIIDLRTELIGCGHRRCEFFFGEKISKRSFLRGAVFSH